MLLIRSGVVKYWRLSAFVALSTLIVGLLLLKGCRGSVDSPSGTRPPIADGPVGSRQQRSDILQDMDPGDETPSVPRPSEINVHALLLEDPRRVALSREELQWLRKHYYPTDQHLAELKSLDIDSLNGTKDPWLGTLQGLALLERGETLPGVAVLRSAGARGAIYSLEQAALAEHSLLQERLGKTTDIDDILRARLEVARALGDHRVDFLIEKHLPNYRTVERAYFVQRHTTEFMAALGREAQLQNFKPVGPDPRPGLDEWRAVEALGKSDVPRTVEVYRLD